jgi:hemoglobin-like flavoprotein
MSAWWHDLWNDPLNENPWALGMLVLILVATFGVFELIYRAKRKYRRRKQETTMNDPADPQPIGEWVASADDRQAADREAAERAIADARAEADGERLQRLIIPERPAPDGATELRDVQDVYRNGDDLTVVSRTVGEDDGEPRRYADNEPIAAAPEREMGEESRRMASLMQTDPRLIADPLGAPLPVTAGPFRQVEIPTEEVPFAQFGRPLTLADAPQPSRNILAGAPVTASAPVPAPLVNPVREPCPHCEGSGFVPSISDHLRASIALVGGSGDEIVKAFYSELLSLAPDLAGLFPRDLLTTDATKGQRDKLLRALIALSEMYDPADEEKMGKLDTALKAFGRSHAAFARTDGTVRGASWEEYAAVKEVLFRTLVAAAGKAWAPEYTASWSQAYDYAAAVMLTEQYRSGFGAEFPRFPRA